MKIKLTESHTELIKWYLNFHRENDQLISIKRVRSDTDLLGDIIIDVPDVVYDYIETMSDCEVSRYIDWS